MGYAILDADLVVVSFGLSTPGQGCSQAKYSVLASAVRKPANIFPQRVRYVAGDADRWKLL